MRPVQVRRASARARGYTLFELVVTIALTSTMLALGMAWVANLITTSAASVDASGASRTVDSIATVLDADFSAALTCPASGSAVRAATLDSLALFTRDPDHEGQALLVTWTLANSTLARSVVPATLSATTCAPTDPATNPQVDPTAAPVSVYATDVTVDGRTPTGTIAAFTSHTPPGASTVSFALRFDAGPTGTAPLTLLRSYPLSTGYAGLS